MKKIILIIMVTALMSGCNQAPTAVESTPPETVIPETKAPETNAQEAPSTQTGQEEQAFTNLELEIGEGSLYIRSGDTFSLTYHDGKIMDYKIDNDTLYIRNTRAGDMVLTLPGNNSYETLLLTVKNGHVYGETPLTVQSFNLKLKQGEVTMEEVSVSIDSYIDVQQGSAFLSGNLGQSVTASCQGGHLNLELPFAEKDYNYEIDLHNGELRLGEDQYHGRSVSQTLDNHSERIIKLTGLQGDISVEFEK